MMDPNSIIQEIGGGLAAVVIVSLATALVIMWRRLNEVQEARLTESRDHNRQLMEMAGQFKDLGHESITSMKALTETVKESIRNG